MKKELDLNKVAFKKEDFLKINNNSFNELGVINITEEIQNEISINDFFELYNTLFYDIPKSGDNSHETLIKNSSEYINFESDSDLIDALQDEITRLRREILLLQINEIDDGSEENQIFNDLRERLENE